MSSLKLRVIVVLFIGRRVGESTARYGRDNGRTRVGVY
jgi:hypothetical protein